MTTSIEKEWFCDFNFLPNWLAGYYRSIVRSFFGLVLLAFSLDCFRSFSQVSWLLWEFLLLLLRLEQRRLLVQTNKNMLHSGAPPLTKRWLLAGQMLPKQTLDSLNGWAYWTQAQMDCLRKVNEKVRASAFMLEQPIDRLLWRFQLNRVVWVVWRVRATWKDVRECRANRNLSLCFSS